MRSLLLRPFFLLLLLYPSYGPAWGQVHDGQLQVVYSPPKSPSAKIWEAAIKEGQFYEKAARRLNNYLAWPRDVLIVVGEIGTANCFYTSDQHRIYMGYEMYDFVFNCFKSIEDERAALRHTFLSMDFFFYHEMGHCLVGEFNLPITGREEDAADDLAAVSLAEGGQYGGDVALAAAQFFEIMSRGVDLKKLPFWDEHSLDAQRFYNILTVFYGSNPNRYMFIEKIVPARTLARSQRDFLHKQRSWDRILNQHLREPKNTGELF